MADKILFVGRHRDDLGSHHLARQPDLTGIRKVVKLLARVLCTLTLSASLCSPIEASDTALPRIGVLPLANVRLEDALRQGLAGLGYIEGKNVLIEWVRPVETNEEKLRILSRQLETTGADVIVAVGSAAARAALQASRVPVVFVVGDPIAGGFAKNLARPGGNGTGVSVVTTELDAKRLELLKQLIPRARRVAVLFNPANPLAGKGGLNNAAKTLDLELISLGARTPEELNGALSALSGSGADGAVVSGDSLMYANMAQVTEAIRKARIPAVFPWREYHDHGALVTYGPDLIEALRRVSAYIDRILRGSKPGETAIEQIATYELVVNLTVAHAMGLIVPQSVLLRADEVIR